MKKHFTALAAALDLMERNPELRKPFGQAFASTANPHYMVKAFYEVMNLPIPLHPIKLSVTERQKFLTIIFSEVVELIRASGFRLDAVWPTEDDVYPTITLNHIEGSQEDHVEMLDGLGDVAFTIFFMAIGKGWNLMHALREITASNLTKLDEDGKPIINGYGKAAPGEPLHRPDEPEGKILKPEGFTRPALARIMAMPQENES